MSDVRPAAARFVLLSRLAAKTPDSFVVHELKQPAGSRQARYTHIQKGS